MSNAMRLGKRTLAGVAAVGLGAALIPFVGVGVANATAQAIEFDVASYTVVTNNWNAATVFDAAVTAYDANGDAIAAGAAIGANREVRVTLTAPATAVDDTFVEINGGGATRGQSYTFNAAATGADLAALGFVTSDDTGASILWKAIPANERGTYSLKIDLVNTTNGSVISTDTMPIAVVSAAGAPTPTLVYANAASNPLNALGATQGAAAPNPAAIAMLNADGGRFVTNLGVSNGDDTTTLSFANSGSTDDTSAFNNVTNNANNETGVYAMTATGVWPYNLVSSSVNATYRVGPPQTANATATLPVSLGTLGGAASLELTNATQGATASDDTVLVPVGTTGLTYALSYTTATRGTVRWNAVSSAGASGAAAPSGGVIATDSTGNGVLSLNVSADAAAEGEVLTVKIQGQDFDVQFVRPGAAVDAVGGLAKVATSSAIVGTVTDVFGGSLTGTWTASLRPEGQVCNATAAPLSTSPVDSEGAFELTVPASAARTSPGVEGFVVCAFNGLDYVANAGFAVNVTYTATGEVTSFVIQSTAPGAGLPVVETPIDGRVNLVNTTGNTTADPADADPNIAGTTAIFKITPVTSPATVVTASVTEGAYLTRKIDGSAAWSAGQSSITLAQGVQMAVYATKPGTHTITVTAGTTSRTLEFVAAVPRDAGRQIKVSSPTIEVSTLQSFPAAATVTDIYGNPVPDAAVTLRGFGAVQDPFIAVDTDSDGVAAFLFTAGEIAGDGVARFIINVPVEDAISGSPTLVRDADTLVTVDAGLTRTIVIVGERGTVRGKPGVLIVGETTGFSNGEIVRPWVRFPGQTSYTQGSAQVAVQDEGFSWQRKTGKKTYVYFKHNNLKSNTVTIPAK